MQEGSKHSRYIHRLCPKIRMPEIEGLHIPLDTGDLYPVPRHLCLLLSPLPARDWNLYLHLVSWHPEFRFVFSQAPADPYFYNRSEFGVWVRQLQMEERYQNIQHLVNQDSLPLSVIVHYSHNIDMVLISGSLKSSKTQIKTCRQNLSSETRLVSRSGPPMKNMSTSLVSTAIRAYSAGYAFCTRFRIRSLSAFVQINDMQGLAQRPKQTFNNAW